VEITSAAYAWIAPPAAFADRQPAGAQAVPAPVALPGAAGAGDLQAEEAIRKAENSLTGGQVGAGSGASVADRASAQSSIAAARALAAQGAYAAARILAEQAARQVDAEAPQLPGAKPEAGAGGAGAPPRPARGGQPRPAEPAGSAGPAGPGESGAPGGEKSGGRTYQDVSDDPTASMKYPTELTPGQAEIAVPAHERGHIIHAQSEAMATGQEVVLAYTQVYYSVDPNTGEIVPAGGQAVVKTRPKPEAPMPFRSWMA
jgi:hypothetical protein